MTSEDQLRPKKNEARPKAPKSTATQSAGIRSDQKRLPWWVEFFFVQIGLPDSLLRSMLKSKKRIKSISPKTRESLGLITLGLSALLYFDPIVKQARLNNTCVEFARDFLIRSELVSDTNNPDEIKAWSHRFCKGGALK